MSVLLRVLKVTAGLVAVAAVAFIISQTVVENEFLEAERDECETRPNTKLAGLADL